MHVCVFNTKAANGRAISGDPGAGSDRVLESLTTILRSGLSLTNSGISALRQFDLC